MRGLCLAWALLSALPLFSQQLVQLPPQLEIPVCALEQEEHDDHELRVLSAFALCYRESYEQAEWVAYELTREELAKNVRRTNDFRPDPGISTGSATLEDYRRSGYDRGHLAPAGDMTFSQQATSESFLLSNVSPQVAAFNGGIWNELENQVRSWAEKYGRVYVVTGPVLEKPASEYEHIGASNVVVPEYFYKVVLTPMYAGAADAATPEDCFRVIVSAYIFPNQKCEGHYWHYRVPVAEVERRTGIDFFHLIDIQGVTIR